MKTPHAIASPHPGRRSISTANFPGAEYTPAEVEFMKAMDRYKRENRRPHPTWSEVLAVLRSLGYRKVAPDRFDQLVAGDAA